MTQQILREYYLKTGPMNAMSIKEEIADEYLKDEENYKSDKINMKYSSKDKIFTIHILKKGEDINEISKRNDLEKFLLELNFQNKVHVEHDLN